MLHQRDSSRRGLPQNHYYCFCAGRHLPRFFILFFHVPKSCRHHSRSARGLLSGERDRPTSQNQVKRLSIRTRDHRPLVVWPVKKKWSTFLLAMRTNPEVPEEAVRRFQLLI